MMKKHFFHIDFVPLKMHTILTLGPWPKITKSAHINVDKMLIVAKVRKNKKKKYKINNLYQNKNKF